MVRFFVFAAALLATSGAVHGAPALELDDCRISAGPGYPSIGARCGQLTRPLNPADPQAGTIDLKVAVVPALSLEPASDPFVPIAGGPGQSTLFFYATWTKAFERVRQHRDILLIDQRGTGDSAPMTCDIDDDIVEGTYSPELTLQVTKDCLALLPHDPRFFTTSVAVTDLEALREALGYDLLNVYGISYGSRVAQHYARRYPDSTRSVILDGVLPPRLPLGPDIATESQRAIDRVFDRCSKDTDCNARFPDIRADFQTVRASLNNGAVSVTLQHPITAKIETIEFTQDHFRAAIRMLLYNPRTIALLPLLINDAANGNYTPLTAQFHMAVPSVIESLSIGMHNAVLCTEDAPFIDWDHLDRDAIESSYLGPVQLEAIQTMCSVWPAGILDDDLRQPLQTELPVLLLSGGADPITPPAYAEMAAEKLSNKWPLTGADQGHGLAAVGCMPRVVGLFVESLRLDDGDADCLEDAFVMPFFIDYSGPMP